MTDPYYLKIKDSEKFLEHYCNIYKSDYNKIKVEKISSILPNLSSKKVIDVGCGGGFYSSIAYEKRGRDITLVDLSKVCVKAARANLRKKPNLNCEGVIADVTHLPFKAEYFDLVFCMDLIEHITNDLCLLSEMYEILKEKGSLILSTQNCNSFNYFIDSIIQRHLLGNKSWMGWDSTHLRFYTPRSLSLMLKKLNFKTERLLGTYLISYKAANYFFKYNRCFSRAVYSLLKKFNDQLECKDENPWFPFGWSIIFLCRKTHSVTHSAL